MRLLFFASDYKIGLSAVLVDQLITLNKKEVLSVCAVAGEKEQEFGLTQKLQDLHVRIKRIPGLDRHAGFFKLVASIVKIIDEENIEIVHVQNNWQLALVVFAKYFRIKFDRIKIIYTIHGFRNNHPVKSFFARIVIGLCLFLFANKIIYMSEYVRRKFTLLSFKMQKNYLGIEDSFFDVKENDIDSKCLKMVFPAQFRPGKNQDMIIRAFSRYIKESEDKEAELYLPGSGELKEGYEKLVNELGTDDQVFFPGQLSKKEIKDLYRSCNIGIVASNSETFGQSIAEPFVLGRCLITRTVGIAPEIIKEGVNGFYFNSENELVNILSYLGKSKARLLETGNINFMKRDLFSWENHSRRYIDLILGIAK